MPNFGKLIEKAKELAGKHPDQVNKGVDKAEQTADEKTGGKYGSQIHEAGDRAEGYLGTQGQGPQGQGPQGQGPQGQGTPGQGTPGQGTGDQ
jgi:MT0933-like antitoxin protein